MRAGKAKFPVRYFEENLVFNTDTGAVYAYYEWQPYNYSFISEDKAMLYFRDIRQMLSSSKAEEFHMLQIAVEEDIRATIGRSKKAAKGELSGMACKYMDGIRRQLEEYHGRYEVGYRFFIGFKLSENDYELSRDNFLDSLKSGIKDFKRAMDETAFGDYTKIDNGEIERYLRLERLLYHKVSRRFRMRKAEPGDMAYVIKHVNGEEVGNFEDYDYRPEVIVGEDKTYIKTYDIIRLSDCLVTEHKRHLDIAVQDGERKVAYLALSDSIHENVFPYGSEVLYYQQENFRFPVDTSVKVEVLHNRDALKSTRNKKAELKDLDESAADSGNETGENLLNARRDAYDLEGDLERGKEDMYKVSYLVRVGAGDEMELAKRVSEVRDFYKSYNMLLERPLGDQGGLHEEFYPSTGRHLNDYVQYVKSDFLASLGFGAAHMLGEREGIYVGYNVATGKSVYLKPWLAAQGVSGSVTNALAKAFTGSLGGGKSVTMNLLAFYCVLFGGRSFILDPKGERGNWEEDLAFLGKHLNIIHVASSEENRGLCDPFLILKDRKEAENLALNILIFLTGCSSRDAKRLPVLTEHVRKVANYPEGHPRGLLHVIRELYRTDTETSRELACHIESFADLGIAGLLFGDGDAEGSLDMDALMNVVLIENLSLPDAGTPAEKYTMTEVLSVAIVLVLSAFSLEFIKQDRGVYKMVLLDEAWSWLQVAEGKTLSNKLVRAGRSMNAGIDFGTQNCDDLLDEKMKNNIGMKFAFRSQDRKEIEKTLAFMGLENTEGNAEVLQTLENGECLFQDIYGNVGVLHVDYVFGQLFKAWDTRPPAKEGKEIG